MRILYGIVLAIVLISIFILGYKKRGDLFSPLCFFALYQFLRYVPIMLYNSEEAFFIVLTDNSLLPTFCFETLFVLCVVFGYSFVKTKKKQSRVKAGISRTNVFGVVDIRISVIIFVFLIGFASRLYIIQTSGGIKYVLRNMGHAYAMLSSNSNGYIAALGNLMTLAILMLMYKISLSKKRKNYVVILIIMIVLGMLSFLVYSSRSPALELLLVVIFGYHYLIKRIKVSSLLKPKALIILAIVFSIIIILPMLRAMSSGSSSIDYENLNIGIGFFDGIGKALEELSTVKVDTFVYNSFNSSNYWHGSNYLNLLVAWIPSSVYHNKPCIDDGVYLCNLMYGHSVLPNMGRNDLIETYSWPFTTPSCLFANFGVLGIAVGGIVLGIIFRKTYCLLGKKNNPFIIYLYFLIVYQLEFSTLSISQAIVPIILCGIVYRCCVKYAGKKINLVNTQCCLN